jgi:hypothetical protein
VVECLPGPKALNSVLSTTKEKKKKGTDGGCCETETNMFTCALMVLPGGTW